MISTINPQVLVPLMSSVPVVPTSWGVQDYLGAFRVRWGIKRNRYRIDPGLYKVGKPDGSSDVFVTANYKLSFDLLRKNLSFTYAWILVLDTKGINVWCAAGKGTFGTDEIVRRIQLTALNDIVSHRSLIVPQLGAVGVSAHEVKKHTGFRIVYGPVRASDIRDFVKNGYKASERMRTIRFNLFDRLKLIPVELIVNIRYFLIALAIVLLLSALSLHGINLNNIAKWFPGAVFKLASAYLSGILIAPILLPIIPARSFALKGFYTGVLIVISIYLIKNFNTSLFDSIAWFLIIPAGSSFFTLNFTGTSTYTSLSGVKKEMKTAIPLQIAAILAGLIILIAGRLFEL